MSWLQQLAEVYDHNELQVGQFEERRNQRITLLPVSHVMQSAQIEILVTPEGKFKSAKVINKENARTIVPATTSSANRRDRKSTRLNYSHVAISYAVFRMK